jgi:hypothetical protein
VALGVSDHVHPTHLDRPGQQVPVMRLARGKWRAVKEAVLWLPLRELLRGLEGVNLAPVLEHVGLGRGDVDRGGRCGESANANANGGTIGLHSLSCGKGGPGARIRKRSGRRADRGIWGLTVVQLERHGGGDPFGRRGISKIGKR